MIRSSWPAISVSTTSLGMAKKVAEREHEPSASVVVGMKRIAIAVIAVSAGCSKQPAALKTLPSPVAAAPAAKPATPITPVSPNVGVSDDLAKQCMLKLD